MSGRIIHHTYLAGLKGGVSEVNDAQTVALAGGSAADRRSVVSNINRKFPDRIRRRQINRRLERNG